MVRRQVELDEETDRLLTDLAAEYDGDAGKAVAELLHAQESIEEFLDTCEQAQSVSLSRQKARSEQGFHEGRSTPWSAVKRQNNL